jgi:imidazolonepropionase-like amidohydrolase
LFGAFRPVASPDGRWLVYATRHDARPALKLLDLETGDDRWLVMDVQRDDSQGGGSRDRDVYPGSVFTPDSRALITSYGGRIMRVDVPSGEAREIPFSAPVELDLGPLARFDYPINDSTLTVSQIRGARPSPDGTRLVFSAVDRLWVAGLPAGDSLTITDARRLTDRVGVEHAPVWSPDGRWITWVTWDDSAGGAIWRTRADGSGQPERLTREAAFFDKIAYSVDGTRIMAVRGSRLHRMRTLEDFGGHGGAAELEYVWLPAAGGPATRIAWVGSGATQQGRNVPHVGPDPARLYVWAGSDGLLSMRWDGTDVRTVARVTGPPRTGTPDEVVLSPDGTRALVRAARNVYLVTVPRVGGTPPTLSVTRGAVPARRLTDIGGDFIGWNADGSAAHWSIGRSYFEYDLATADSVAAELEAREAAEEAAEAAEPDEEEPDEEEAEEEEQEEEEKDDDDDERYRARRVDVEIVLAKDRPQGVVMLRGARLITMNGDEVIEDGELLVRDNRIVALGPAGSLDVPADARVVDVAGRTIMPGLVDIHAHTWVAWGVHRNQVSQFLAQLAYGVTTQRDPQTSSEDVLTYFDRMELGELIGPRLYSTGPGVFGADNISSLDEARDVLRRYADHFDTRTIKQYLAGDRKVRQWVIMAAHELGLTPTTEGGSNFTMNMTLAQDGYAGLEHALPIAPFFDDVVRLGAFSQMTYTPTLIVAYGGPSGFQYWLTRENVDTVAKLRYFTPHDELDKWRQTTFYREDQYVHPLHAEQLTKWVRAGGRVGLGSHGELQGLGTHWELWMMASGGMDAHDALRAATLHGADAIGLAGDLGSLEPGKLADLVILEANPLDDVRNTNTVTHVMKNGRLYEGDTLTEIWPRQRPLEAQWWWRLEPGG